MSNPTNSTLATPTREEVLEAVKSIVSAYASMSPQEIAEAHHLINDLGCDSLDVVEITMEIEEHFDMSVPDELTESAPTVRAVVDGVMLLLKNERR